MKTRYLLCILSTILILSIFTGCDSVDEALEWKNRYDELEAKYVELEAKYEAAQVELKKLKSNANLYIKNTKIMLQDD